MSVVLHLHPTTRQRSLSRAGLSARKESNGDSRLKLKSHRHEVGGLEEANSWRRSLLGQRAEVLTSLVRLCGDTFRFRRYGKQFCFRSPDTQSCTLRVSVPYPELDRETTRVLIGSSRKRSGDTTRRG